jgi:hypothetical protein
MGWHPSFADQAVFHVHPSRYTVATVDWFQGPDRHSRVRYFEWLIDLDRVGVDIRGGVYSDARDGWHVFSEEVAPYVSSDQAGAAATVFHPDFPVCGGTGGPAPPLTRMEPLPGKRAPVELSLTHHAGGRGTSRARAAVAWRCDGGTETSTISREAAASAYFRAPGHAGAAEAQD